MPMGLAMSAALGLAFGAAYVGLVVRLTVALAAVTAVLTLTDVDATAFVLSFFGAFALSVAFDLARLVRAGRSPAAPRSPSAS